VPCGKTVTARRCVCGSDRLAWTYAVDVAPSGQPRKQALKGGFATKALAVQAMNLRQVEEEQGTRIEPTRLTVEAWLAEWLPGMRSRVRGGTWVNYELTVRRHIVPAIGRVPLQQLTRARIKTLYADLQTRLSPKTVSNVHMTLRRSLRDAVEDGLIARNPADQAYHLPRDGRPEMKVWDGAQVATFLDSVKDDRLFALWRLAATGCMRRGELLGLRWADLDMEASSLGVQRARVRGIDGWTTGKPKTTKGRRRIALDADTVTALRTHRKAQLEERMAFGPAWADEALVFCREDGTPLDPDSVTGMFERLARRAGLPRIRLHDFTRHTAASLLLAAGVNVKAVSERLGHSSAQMTLDVYSHVTPGIQEDAAERLSRAIGGRM